MATFGLAMIVKNEADNIRRCLDSVKHRIDTWTIIDTGSTDDTKTLIEETPGLPPGRLLDSTFTNFRDNRSELMREARGSADWLILLDADMVFHYDGDLQQLPEGFDAFAGRIGQTALDYKLPLIVKGDNDWRYEGVAHSYLACTPPNYQQHTLPGLWVEDHSRTGPHKLEMDIRLLSEELAKNPLDPRSVFYLAQSYADLDRIPEAIHYYRMRANMNGWEEETYVARQKLGALLCENVSFAEGAKILLDAWEKRPNRAETLRILARVADNVADKIPYPDDLLFVHSHAYAQRPTPGITPDKVSAVMVTRGDQPDAVDQNVRLAKEAGIGDVVVWDNSKRDQDMKTFGRYLGAAEADNDVIFTVDDDVVFTRFQDLFVAYEPGKAVCNMDGPWYHGAGYDQANVCQVGAGALWDRNISGEVWAKWFAHHDLDEFTCTWSDAIFGSLAPHKIVDFGYQVHSFTDAPGRLWTTPGNMEKKWQAIRMAKELA